MLQITVPETEIFDGTTECFILVKEQTILLEHSLVSLSKWESKWCKPFLYTEHKTNEETIDYIKCMTITKNVKPEVYQCLTAENIKRIHDYIYAPMTATTINNKNRGGKNREIITSEVIYYQMIALNIPFECEKWHLNRLITLIRVCDIKNQPAKKMSSGEIKRQNAALNAARRKKLNTRG